MTAIATPATAYPFKPTEAVYHIVEPKKGLAPILRPGMVVRPAGPLARYRADTPRVGLVLDDGRRISVCGSFLAYRGYCRRCDVPAVLDDGRLVCPLCKRKARQEPPPDHLTLLWYPIGESLHAQAVRHCIVHKCSWEEGLDAWRKWHFDSFERMINKYGLRSEMYARREPWQSDEFRETAQWYAERDDEAGFVAYYKANGGELPEERVARFFTALAGRFDDELETLGPSRRLQLPPLVIPPTPEDSEPDGDDELTAWLRRQFEK